MNHVLTIFLTGLCVIASASAEDKSGEAKRALLSKHETIATFQGLKYRKCLGRTAACPDRCGQSGEFATFKIIEYLNYEKPGKYGDPRQKSYRIQVSDFHRKPKGDKQLLGTIKTLRTGDRVHLSWRHDYVTTKGGSKFPDRVVTKLSKD